ncbi:hypothetical protein FKM82_010066 [Ascaphus truei]
MGREENSVTLHPLYRTQQLWTISRARGSWLVARVCRGSVSNMTGCLWAMTFLWENFPGAPESRCVSRAAPCRDAHYNTTYNDMQREPIPWGAHTPALIRSADRDAIARKSQ